ncbi:hypothetical protein P4K96_29065 [Bacillus cereus]|uniref:hypothetical protein n=1 Tax=Paenibacillus melissococcoides TaxID=2912268 RepID=UPI002DC25352|nr:hypothetical protein [Bacillus cereus]
MPDTMQQPVRDWQTDWEMCVKAAPGPYGYDFLQYPGPHGQVEEYTIITPSGEFGEDEALLCAESREALPYWLQEYQKKNECHIEVQTAYSGLLCEYHNFKETFRALARKCGATENRERTLLTAIKIAIDEYGQWQDKAAAAHIMFGALNEAINQVYGEDKP